MADARGALAVPPPFEDVWGTLGSVGGGSGGDGLAAAGMHMPVRVWGAGKGEEKMGGGGGRRWDDQSLGRAGGGYI